MQEAPVQEPLEGIYFNFALLFYSLLYFLYDDVNNNVNDDDDNDVNTFL